VLVRFAALGQSAAPLPHRSLLDNAGIVAAAALQYTKKLVWPWPLALDYDLRHSAAAWLAFAAALGFAIWAAYRRPALRLPLLLTAVPLLPALAASLVLPELSRAQDRYAYTAVLGLALLVARVARGRTGVAAALALLAVWTALSAVAIRHWRDPETLWTHTLRVTPNSKNAVLGLGEWYYMTRRLAEAERVYTQGLAFRPNDPDLLASRAAVRKAMGASPLPSPRASGSH